MQLIHRIKLIALGLLSILAVSLWLSNSALPSSQNLYNLKRLQEKLFLAIQTKPDKKVNFYLILLDKRLDELKSLEENREFPYLLPASLRYSTTAGLITELTTDAQLTDSVPAIEKKFRLHQQIIDSLYSTYQHDENNEGRFIQDDYNYLAIYLQQLSDEFKTRDQDR